MNTRAIAAEVLERVVFGGESLTAALDRHLPGIAAPRDRAFVQSIAFGVCRWYWELAFLLRRLADRPIKDHRTEALALVGLYQLTRMRVKPHAAVAETVAAAHSKPWSKPFLNGLLRNFERQRERLLDELQYDETARESHPAWLLRRICADWPEDWQRILAANNASPPFTLRVNSRRLTRAEFLTRLAEHDIAGNPGEFSPDAVILDGPRAIQEVPGFMEGLVSVQDEAPQLAAPLLRPEAGQRVLDVCAAPGGKALHLLESCPGLQELVALDVSDERAQLIRENLDRLGLRATIGVADGCDRGRWWDGKPYDRILLDAPCSATGVIRRHPDIKLLRQEADIAALSRQQKALLTAVWPALKPDGILLYATCSVLKAENDAVVEAFLRGQPDAVGEPIDGAWGRPTANGRQILTGDHGMDGFFYARLRKTP